MRGSRLKTPGSRLTAAGIGVLLLIAGCERPFVEAEPPELEIVGPDFSTIVSLSRVDVAVRANSDRSIESVTVNGQPLSFEPAERLWSGPVGLVQGLNRLIFEAVDSEDRVTRDTAYAFRAALFIHRSDLSLPEPRGGHTTTLLADGSILVTGGAERSNGPASNSAFILEPGASEFRPTRNTMAVARSGHTATLLPDGRVLILGGSQFDHVDDLGDLAGPVEIYDPTSDAFDILDYQGEPIRRAFHTAAPRSSGGGTVVDVYGGRGDVRYRPQPGLGTRRDLQSFTVRNDSLIALSPFPGPLLDARATGHIQVALDDDDRLRYLIAGTDYSARPEEDVSFILDYTAPQGISQDTTGALVVGRTRHAGENVVDGIIAVFGGTGETADALADVELYVHDARRFFRFPTSEFVLRRFGLTATKLPNQRILLLGGFSPTGEGLTSSEIFQAPPL